MEAKMLIELTVLVIVIASLVMAAVSDYRTREVSDRFWLVIGVVGLAGYLTSSIISEGFRIDFFLNFLAGGLFLTAVLIGSARQDILLGILALALSVYVLMEGCGSMYSRAGAVSVLMCFVFLLGYYTGILRGGADAKCLMAISLAIPVYPDYFSDIGGVNEAMKLCFGPSVAIMIMASIISMAGCIVYCMYQNRGRAMCVMDSISGYVIPTASLSTSFAWPAEDIVDRVRVKCRADDDYNPEEVCRRFEDEGISEIFVTPMIPFVVPIAIATVLMLFIGNPMFSV